MMFLLVLLTLGVAALAWSALGRRAGSASDEVSGSGGAAVAADPLQDARAGARHRIDRLAAGIALVDGVDAPDPSHEATARTAVAEASERLAAARATLAGARTPRQVELAARCAAEGLYALRPARTALGVDPGAPVDVSPAAAASGSAL